MKKNRLSVKLIFTLLLVVSLAFVTACGNGSEIEQEDENWQDYENGELEQNLENDEQGENAEQVERIPLSELTANTLQASIVMQDGGVIVVELYPDLAPHTVSNFVYLARNGFYDGLRFHRIIEPFMIQGGCPDATGTGYPGHRILGEFEANGIINDLSHERGTISMARANPPNSAGSQFFITTQDSFHLDGSFAGFGRVIDGMDVLDRLASTPNSGPDGAVYFEDMPVIETITIDEDFEKIDFDRF